MSGVRLNCGCTTDKRDPKCQRHSKSGGYIETNTWSNNMKSRNW